jgi:hypothetical protein
LAETDIETIVATFTRSIKTTLYSTKREETIAPAIFTTTESSVIATISSSYIATRA